MNRKSLQVICSVVLVLLSGVSVFLGSRSLAHASSSSMHAQSLSASAPNNPLPSPSWWNGTTCDTARYSSSHQLGTASYRGLIACGPRPLYDYPKQDVAIAHGAFEWECVELSMRYLYLAYGIAPYSANGSQVVSNYSGSLLKKIANGTPGQAPQAGDVLSYGSTKTNGHTSVVINSSVDGNGNGSITVLEENASSNGTEALRLSNWVVQLWFGMKISGWLHNPSPPPPPPPPPSPSPFNPRFVMNIFHDILNRQPSSSELNGNVQALNQGEPLGQMTITFLSSSEYRTDLITNDYQWLLHRAPDPSGLNFWVQQLNNGSQDEDVIIGLASSDEYYSNRGGGNNTGYVTALFHDILQRNPDPSGLNFWVQQLNNGTPRWTIVSGLVNSGEYRKLLVDSDFQHYLNRNADLGGENFYINMFNQGGKDEEVAADLAASDEYFAKPSWLSVRYITNLYHDIMSRKASQVDVNWWSQALDHGSSLAHVANSFLASSEYRTNLVTAAYQQVLHRTADASGSAFYVEQLNNGMKNEDVLVGLAASDEYFTNRGGGTNSGFVNALYQDLLQRAADPSGLAYWTQQLNNGVSHATVAQGLLTSTEYRTKLVDDYYSHYLGRAADPGGENYYVSILNNGGTDESVIAGLAASDEYFAKPSSS